MKLVYMGAAATAVLLAVGILLVAPAFTDSKHQVPRLSIMLSFNILDATNQPDWCTSLSEILRKHNIKATVFVSGKVADRFPGCVSTFAENDKVDLGSLTYSYVSLPSIADYSVQLEEVRTGKEAVDEAGGINSRIFRAPYGDTDDNIYSLLSRSDILADFSYEHQYNKYHNGEFLRFDLNAYDGSSYNSQFFLNMQESDVPIIINFDNYTAIQDIDEYISDLKSGRNKLLNASELTGLDLTIRGVAP